MAPCPTAGASRGEQRRRPVLHDPASARTVEVWALGEQGFRVKASDQELVVEGHNAAIDAAQRLASVLG